MLLAVLAALVGVALLAVPASPLNKEPTLGLDLQGGLEVVLEAQPQKDDRELTDEDLDRSVDIIRERIDKLGVSEPEVRQSGTNQISVQLAGVFDRERAVNIIGSTAQLELYKLEADLVPPSVDRLYHQPVAQDSLFSLLAPVSKAAQENAEAYYLFNPQKKLIAGPLQTREKLVQTEAARCLKGDEDACAAQAAGGTGTGATPASGGSNKNPDASGGDESSGERAADTSRSFPKGTRILAQPANTKIITCDKSARFCPSVAEAPPSQTYYYLFRYTPNAEEPIPEMTGEDLNIDGTRQDFDTQAGGEPIVLMQFTDAGANKFHDVTRDLAQDGRQLQPRLPQGTPAEDAFQRFAIVLDDEIKSFPTIDFEENPDGIPGDNGAQITGIGSINEAKDLALVLQTGALPITFKIADETTVSATLGEDSLRQALKASVAGLILVALFLLVIYRFLGVVAVIGLGIYAAFLYAVIVLFDVTLTLPGFAGMALTIGVAADANIVIFERIKEESRAGKSVRAAIANGYTKGFSTIIDANVVTAITAVILFVIATSGVRGFALLLLLGTGISIITAVLATRALLGILAGFRWFDNPAFMGASPREVPAWQRVDIVGRRRIWFILAGISIAITLAAVVFKGLNLGIDFEGGSQLAFETPRAVQIENVRDQAAEVGLEGAVIQGRGEEGPNQSFREFQIRAESFDQADVTQLTTALEREFDATVEGIRNVSASFSEQILRGAIYAMVVSFLLIALYVTIRFEWRFAVPILRTIGNDGVIVVGIYALSGREVSAATVAAFLTIIGYSIYDTIIIFDRVRENIPLMRRSTIAQIINVSLWETIPRSLATTFITLLPVSCLFFFGGETLKDFAFAILTGISVSAFSTIFIAAPFLAVLKEREPEYKRRTALAAGDGAAQREDGKVLAPPTASAEQEPPPELAPTVDTGGDGATRADARRERRRQRRRSRPHGRAR